MEGGKEQKATNGRRQWESVKKKESGRKMNQGESRNRRTNSISRKADVEKGKIEI